MSVPDVPVLLIIMGGILFFIAVVGGGIKSKWVEFQQILSSSARITSGILGVLLIITGIILSIHVFKTPSSPSSSSGQTSTKSDSTKKPDQIFLSLKGQVIDTFGNPRNDVIVIAQGLTHYAITNKRGEFLISKIPLQNNITLQARFGSETDEMIININVEKPTKEINLSEPMILKPIKLETFLCKQVEVQEGEGINPIGVFESENYQISLSSLDSDGKNKIIWCFVKVVGPAKYEVGKKTELFFEWYLNDQLQTEPFKTSVGVSPFGWRTRASKKVWVGKWRLKIVTKYQELANIPFEIFK